VLLDAAARLPGDVLVLLVGEGGLRRALAKQAARLGIAERVRFCGHADDMPAALLLADLVVHASTDPEAFGRTVIEAQAMARPVIASDLGAPRETVEEGVTGWRVAPGDPEALAAAIRRALEMPPDLRAAVGGQARAAVLGRYTKRAMQDATLALYRELP
jgi:glycosyltransferase involved in cell wall biosynthesis